MTSAATPGVAALGRLIARVALVAALAALLPLLLTMDAHTRAVSAPLVAAVVLAVAAVWLLWWRERELPTDEIGLWYVAAVTAYTVLPLAIFLALGMEYTILNDNRLLEIDPTPREVGFFGWLYVTYLFAFLVAYVPLAIGARRVERRPMPALRRSRVGVAAFLWFAALVFAFGLGIFFDLSAGSYTESYLVVQQLPLGVRQAEKVMRGLRFVSGLLLLTWLFQDYARRRAFIALALGALTVMTVLEAGSRTELVLHYAAAAILYHRFVAPIRLRTALPAALVGLVFFLGLGVYRTWRALDDPGAFAVGVSAGEFESIFANAVDLWARRDAGQLADAPAAALMIGDLVGFVPSQLLPIQKLNAATWYIGTFYPEFAEAGGGFAFGVVAQSIVGFGVVELFARGLLVGALCALLFRWYRARAHGAFGIVLYLWLTLWAYQSFRMTTFQIGSEFVQQLLFSLLVIEFGRRFVDEAIRPGERRMPVASPLRGGA